MKLMIPVVAVLVCVASASVFPDDPSGVDVIDRAFLRVYPEEEELDLYITLFNSEGRGTVKIDEYRNGEWETVCTWNPRNLGDEFMVFHPIAVLSIFDPGGIVQVSWIDRVDCPEGMVSFYIQYDYVTGEWEEGWVD
jgi:hypothetical protein